MQKRSWLEEHMSIELGVAAAMRHDWCASATTRPSASDDSSPPGAACIHALSGAHGGTEEAAAPGGLEDIAQLARLTLVCSYRDNFFGVEPLTSQTDDGSRVVTSWHKQPDGGVLCAVQNSDAGGSNFQTNLTPLWCGARS